jgi:lipoprotein NlpI
MNRIAPVTAFLLFLACHPLFPAQLFYDDGLAQMNAGHYREAAKSFEKAVEQDPRDPKAWERLGDTYVRLGENAKALEAYGRSLEIKPSNRELRNWMNLFKVKAANVPAKEASQPAISRVAEVCASYGFAFLKGGGDSSQALGVWAGYRLNPRVALGGLVDYIIFQNDTGMTGGNREVMFAAAAVKLNFNLKDGPIMPYFVGGAGLLNRSMGTMTSSTGPGGTVGLGIPMRVQEHLLIVLDVRETAGFTRPEKTAFHQFNIGLLYLW